MKTWCGALMVIGTVTAGAASAATVDVTAWPQVPAALPDDPALEAQIDAWLARMTVAQKVGQVIQGEIGSTTAEDVARYHLGSVLNGGGTIPGGDKRAPASVWLAAADTYWDASTKNGAGIPVLWGVDAVHGHNNVRGATLFPHNIAIGATRDPILAEEIGRITAREIAVTGLDWDFAPTVAVVQDDRWGRSYEGYSERPEVVALLARATISGLQGRPGTPEFLGPDRVLATAKHFIGDGGTVDGRDQGDNVSTEAQLRELHAPGYVAALGVGVQTVMASFSSWQGTKMHGHGGLLNEVLKQRMGFDGFVIGDWNGHGQVPGCSNSDCPDALLAGVDMYMVPQDWKALWESVHAQVASGEIPMDRLDDAVRRILRVKLRFGLPERGRPSSRPLAGRDELLGAPEHRAVAREAVRRSLVLLKNDGGVLPLQPGQRVVVVGDAADDIGRQTGGWTLSWQGTGNTNEDFPGATSIWDGIRQAVEAAGGTARLVADPTSAALEPGSADVVIAVYGETPYAEFQGDVDTLDYQADDPKDRRLLDHVRAIGAPVVSVFVSGRPLWVNPELNRSDAFVAAWLPGSEGAGVADMLFRAADGQPVFDFVGRLPFSWPRTSSQMPNVGQPGYDPLFPFGYGLGLGDQRTLGTLSEEGAAPPGNRGRRVYFDRGVVAPWRLVTSGGATAGAVDRLQQGDALGLSWSARGTVALRGDSGVDLSREANGAMALALDVRVVAPGAVALAMACGDGCGGELPIGERLAQAPLGEWVPLRYRLSCFVEAGLDPKSVTVPLALTAEAGVSLEVANVRLVSAAEGPAPCPER